MSDLRALVREVLSEELARLRPKADTPARPQATEEVVTLGANADLAAFVKRLLAMDGRMRADIEAGRHVFRLGAAGGAQTKPGAAAAARFDRGLITERDVARLDAGAGAIQVGGNVRLTPLAVVELRRRAISIERVKT